ncbi:PAS domain-containing sensor histidine kinase [Pseudoduganella ginsengisoli]|uniref:histidine kinase n=1 Tax=Pseudoduganella ginsengisoli TaxID=1462440 RepID=A0A6L6Q1X0_9BURK|nr:PAS domain S-box protein [Pseudoduganella ginsengisoli]MTW03311.1 PAS domain S-box protein [Pseudoduganella ginsengisoli]
MATDFAKLILDETPDAVIVTTPDGEVVYWTRGAQSVFGYTGEEALGRTLASLIVPPDMVEAERRVLRQTLTHGNASYESLRRARDGALVYIDSSAKAVRNAYGTIEYILWNKKDVTQLKVLRDAKLVEAHFGNVLESTPDAIVMANAAGRVVLATSRAYAMFGYEPGQLRGQPLENLMPVRFRNAHARHRDHYFAQPQSRQMGAGRHLFGLRKNGEEFPIEISLSPIKTEEGTLIMSAIRDITERKNIEQALYEKNLALAQANQAKDRFLASMSHELRTPLNAILGFTGTLLMCLPGPLTDEQERQLRTIQGSARQLLVLINDLLDLTKIASGKVELQLQPVGCHALLAELLAEFRPQAQRKGLALDYMAPDRDLTVHGDRRALLQILGHLVGNAIKFTEHGTVQVILARSEIRGRAFAAISVSDTGAGISPDMQGRLFEAFSQLGSGERQQAEGAGLGLHLCQKLAKLLDGEIQFESRHGEGSVFTLAVPLQQ